MQSHEWNRPELPEKHCGWGYKAGAACLVLGCLALLIWATAEGNTGGFLIFGAALTALGLNMAIVSKFLREIRRIAFEAAIRAGETALVDTSE